MNEYTLRKSDKFLRIQQFQSLVGLSRSQIYALISRGNFPKQVKVSEKASAWLESEVDSWMTERVASRALKSGDWSESPSKD